MRNMCLGITAFAVTVGMVAVGAQGRNFSGTWVLDSEKTMAAAQAAAGSGETGGAIVARGGGAGGGGRAVGGVISGGGSGGSVAPTAAVRSGGGGGAVMSAAGGGGGRVASAVSTDMVITMDASHFTVDQSGFQTTYPTNGTEVTVATRGGTEAKVKASWKGDTLVVEQTIDSPNGPTTNTTSWFLEGDSLVRLTSRRTYYKKK